MSTAQKRQAVLEMCEDFAAARLTGNPRVLNAVMVDIELVRLPKLFPEKPTLESVLAEKP